MSTIEKKKPSQLNEFEGDYTGEEIVQVTRAGVGTYKTTMAKLRDYFGIIAMTEEEFENIENPVEGAFYATYEE